MDLSHVRLLARDFGASLRFYRDVVGLDVRTGDESGPYSELLAGPTVLALFDAGLMSQALGWSADTAPRVGDRAVICFAVEDVDAAFAQLKRRGGEVVAEPRDRREWQIRTAHFRDPEGNLIEINQPLG